MTRRGVALSLVVFVGTAAAARPEAVAIDHKAVGCIVVGKYPKMNACFTPAADLARSRVYFRPEGAASWYYVDMKSDQTCFTGTLPRPGKKLVGKKIEYYVEAQNKAFEPARTAEFDPIVVKSAQECKKNVPVAPFLNNATVAVVPSVPAGFVGGSIGTAAVVGVVGAGAAAVGTAAVVASNNNNDTTTTTTPVVVNPTTTTTTLATSTSTTTTLPTTTNHPPLAVLTTNPDPPSGTGPLKVTFDLCKSTDPDKDALNFFFDFGDGSKTSGSCLESHTYQSNFRAEGNLRAQDRSYSAEACVVDTSNDSSCRSRTVIATNPAPTCNTAPPTITITAPKEGDCIRSPAVSVSANAANTNSVNFQANRIPACDGAPVPDASATVTGSSPFSTTLNPMGGQDCYELRATATNTCTGATASAGPVNFTFGMGIACYLPARAQGKGRDLVWSSGLGVEGGRLQVVVNGGLSSFPVRGRSYATAASVEGDNRVEAVLVEASGKPGLWRFDLMTTSGVAPGSIRVIAGEPVQVSSTSVTFRLQGQVGERVVFTFQKK